MSRRRGIQRGGVLIPHSEAADGEQRRRLLAELRANGVNHELREGREFVVLCLPDVERADETPRAPVELHVRMSRARRLA